eukprot:3953162-Pleurochrysis_carterae.AAC.1
MPTYLDVEQVRDRALVLHVPSRRKSISERRVIDVTSDDEAFVGLFAMEQAKGRAYAASVGPPAPCHIWVFLHDKFWGGRPRPGWRTRAARGNRPPHRVVTRPGGRQPRNPSGAFSCRCPRR